MFASKKTYILAGIAILSAWGSYLAGVMDLSQAIEATFAALATMTIRHGITTEVTKATEVKS